MRHEYGVDFIFHFLLISLFNTLAILTTQFVLTLFGLIPLTFFYLQNW